MEENIEKTRKIEIEKTNDKLAEVEERLTTLKDRWAQSKVADQQRKEDLLNLVKAVSASLAQYPEKETEMVITGKGGGGDGIAKIYFCKGDVVKLEHSVGKYSPAKSYKELENEIRTLTPTLSIQILEYALDHPEAIGLKGK